MKQPTYFARRSVTALMFALNLGLSGCLFGDYAADRKLELHQTLSTGNYSQTFDVDTSQLPAGAIEARTVSDTRSGKSEEIDISGTVPIRVVLLPAGPSTQPGAGQ